MSLNGCHNRPPLRDTAIVQSGWREIFIDSEQVYTRVPVMIYISDPMTKRCVYSQDNKNDPKCIGCKHLEN